jgi:hypothetical protein
MILKLTFYFLLINIWYFNVFTQENNFLNSKIIGIGEASHGEKNIYFYRYQIIKELLESNSDINIAVEMPYFAGIGIKDYFNEKITKDSLLNTLGFYGLQTDAFLELLDSSKLTREKINYFGIDM